MLRYTLEMDEIKVAIELYLKTKGYRIKSGEIKSKPFRPLWADLVIEKVDERS